MGATAPIPPAPPEEAATKGEAGPVVAPPASASAAATAPAATTAPTAQPAPAATPATRRTLPAEAVRAVVRAHSSEIQDCVERAQMEQPLLRARVAVSATVGRGGQVSAVTTSAAGGGTARLRACIQSAWQGWTFPEPPGGEPARISYTFVFE
ncbi:MAG TPA: AgmX/PglI C-terminal domain-containing protein [Polyangiaceae bacterium]|nr:AgmX/PglI C-terminal domain-containing protein [Polyangiaceae bacterium]